jgi:hypothetical protein
VAGGVSADKKADADLARLPRQLVDRLTKPFVQFLRIEAAAGALLLAFAVAAVAGVALLAWLSPRLSEQRSVGDELAESSMTIEKLQ